mmetsp:Transcript_21754/g.55464  ORF Transcript_21754/g.55464 Transcript_21754/m.55464 type:complete len:212 (-) Transcript_21754:455-1090(-)
MATRPAPVWRVALLPPEAFPAIGAAVAGAGLAASAASAGGAWLPARRLPAVGAQHPARPDVELVVGSAGMDTPKSQLSQLSARAGGHMSWRVVASPTSDHPSLPLPHHVSELPASVEDSSLASLSSSLPPSSSSSLEPLRPLAAAAELLELPPLVMDGVQAISSAFRHGICSSSVVSAALSAAASRSRRPVSRLGNICTSTWNGHMLRAAQ